MWLGSDREVTGSGGGGGGVGGGGGGGGDSDSGKGTAACLTRGRDTPRSWPKLL